MIFITFFLFFYLWHHFLCNKSEYPKVIALADSVFYCRLDNTAARCVKCAIVTDAAVEPRAVTLQNLKAYMPINNLHLCIEGH